ncbi:hypothetical protein J2X69_001790 [Algoriphagus sp. 4150]|uniref:hypothetical protein n=1 Tax=Algoriphagus sp. 4150 TaxID=2817756 RepID=UPI0028679440|nr:hypothetical protein [Algoriphagus sp. 4150]MDR7129453.1 hypothetical protein [Algoriphagus sp. 4150]
MKNLLVIPSILALISCGKMDNTTQLQSDPTQIESLDIHVKDTTVQFLWRDMKYDSALNDSFNSIFLNLEYVDIMEDPEKAALGYVATFIGNECWWDGDAEEDRSNLDCKIITALGLGYQCSDRHLGFLKEWFSDDPQVLAELESANCPTTPYTATIQDTFDEIELTVKGDSIIVNYKVSAINFREQKNWEWSVADYFVVKGDKLMLINRDKSEVGQGRFDLTGG